MTQVIANNALLIAEPQLAKYVIDNKLMLPQGISFSDWDNCGVWLAEAERVLTDNLTLVRLLRADWWRAGVIKFREKVHQAQAIFGVSGYTIANDASEIAQVDDKCRLVNGATFEQMAGVKAAPKAQQVTILEQAVNESWSRARVEQEASGLDEDSYQRQKTLRVLRNAYNKLDKEGREDFDAWYKKVRKSSP